MAFLFDTNALSELFRRRPNARFVEWLKEVPAHRQFSSTVVVAELYVAAFRSSGSDKWLHRIRKSLLTKVNVLPFDLACAEVAGRVQADLMDRGQAIESSDVLIAATALRHRLTLVTANVRHYDRVPDLQLVTFEPGEKGRFEVPERS